METLIVMLIVAAAAAYAGKKAWDLFKPGSGAGCGCSAAKDGCGGCPAAKPRPKRVSL